MYELKNVWLRQDAVGRTVMVTGLLAAVACLIMGRPLTALILMAAMVVVCVLYAQRRADAMYRAYGVLYYTLPDGEEVALLLEQLEKRHVGRAFTLRCPYDGVNAFGDWDTGLGLMLDMSGCDAIPKLRRGEMMAVEGTLGQDGDVFYLLAHSCIRL